ncbi:MAG: hypothetical protein ACPGLV_04995 [Bacteroidia bacterium]
MIKKLFSGILIVLFIVVFAKQSMSQSIEGTVSFITSENIYVRFTDASKIEIGDTLKLVSEGSKMPCLVVVNKSSTSCVTNAIGGCNPEKGAKVEAVLKSAIADKKKVAEEKPQETDKAIKDISNAEKDLFEVADSIDLADVNNQKLKHQIDETFDGRFSLANYTTNDLNATRNRTMARLALDANNIANTKLGFESYVNFTHLATDRTVDASFQANRFNIYNLALSYKRDSNYSIYLGRRINNKMASVGATDGLQAEKEFGNLSVGLLAGFRPNVFNYSLDFTLPQFGAYLSLKNNINSWRAQTTVGAIEQKNNGSTDRRYIYFQHSSSIKKLSIFGSAQADLYEKVNGQANASFSITGLYLSARYRFGKKLSAMASYDSRKNLIFYESYAPSLSILQQNNPTRQGYRLRLNYRFKKYVSIGASYNTRLQSDNKNTFNNYSIYARHAKLPLVGGSMYISHNRSLSNSINYSSTSANYNKYLLHNKLSFETYYRLVQYNYSTIKVDLPKQHYFGLGLNVFIAKKTSISLLGERSQRQTYYSNRFNVKLIQRF